jgi:hypothetical protein
MEVEICVDAGTNMAIVEKEYPDMYADGEDGDRYFVGKSSDETVEAGESEWLNYHEAVECCGFVEGAIPGASVLIEGNGGWAQSMISRRDFSGLAVSKKEKASYKRTSNRFWKAFERGRKARKKAVSK